MKKKKWVASINRYKTVVEQYEKTVYVEEAIHRLVEIHYRIGLVEESKKYASLLGYNYLSGEWYKKSYKIFNRDDHISIAQPRIINYNNAEKYDEISYKEVVSSKLKVMDLTAITLCEENEMPIRVFDGTTPGNIYKALTLSLIHI